MSILSVLSLLSPQWGGAGSVSMVTLQGGGVGV